MDFLGGSSPSITNYSPQGQTSAVEQLGTSLGQYAPGILSQMLQPYSGQTVAPLSAQQNQTLQMYQQILNGAQSAGQTPLGAAGQNATQEILNQALIGANNPAGTQLGQGLIQQSGISQQNAINALKNQAGNAGYLYSDPYQEALGNTMAQYGANLNTELGNIGLSEQNTGLNAAGQAQEMATQNLTQPLQQLLSGYSLAALPQQQQQNVLTSAEQTAQQPQSNYEALLQQLLGYQPDMVGMSGQTGLLDTSGGINAASSGLSQLLGLR